MSWVVGEGAGARGDCQLPDRELLGYYQEGVRESSQHSGKPGTKAAVAGGADGRARTLSVTLREGDGSPRSI